MHYEGINKPFKCVANFKNKQLTTLDSLILWRTAVYVREDMIYQLFNA